jgi:hypothetical protein
MSQAHKTRRHGLRNLFVCAFIITVFACGWIIFTLTQDPVAFFEKRRCHDVKTTLCEERREPGIILQSLKFQAGKDLSKSSEIEFDAYLCKPEHITSPQPAFILLGGLVTGREAIQEVARRPEAAQRGVFFTLDYPYHGPATFEGLQILPHLPAIRKAVFDGVEAVRLAVDYLERQPGVDPRRILLLGVSLGSFYSIAAGAVDSRPAAVMAFMAGGDLCSLLSHNLQRGGYVKPALLSAPLAALAAMLIRPLEHLNLVGRISPRPYIQISAENDTQVPLANARELYEAAADPRSLVWIKAPHLKPGMEDVIDQLFTVADQELIKLGVLK